MAKIGRPLGSKSKRKKYRWYVWNKRFTSLKEVSEDPRCFWNVTFLTYLVRFGIPLSKAVGVPPRLRQYKVWGQHFNDLKSIAKDPRCKCSYHILLKKLQEGHPLQEVVDTYVPDRYAITCWGETFVSLYALSRDPRCTNSYKELRKLYSKGHSIEQAATPFGLD